MADFENTGEDRQVRKTADAPATQPSALPSSALPPPHPPPPPPVDSDPKPREPILVQLVGDEELKPFEQQSLAIARESLAISRNSERIAIAAFAAAFLAALFVYFQVKVMSYQTQIMNAQSESAAGGAAIDEWNTQKQLKIAQQQAEAAQDSVTVIRQQMRTDERPWLEFKEGSGNINFTVGQAISLPIQFSNIGRTPALHIRAFTCVQIMPVGHDPEFTEWNRSSSIVIGLDERIPKRYETGKAASKVPSKVTPPCNWVETAIIYPQGNEGYSFSRKRINGGKGEDDPLRLDEFKCLTDSTAYFSIYGQIWYRDVFGVHHWTKFCASKTFNGTPSQSRKCANYSDVDHN
jgi:hypothetical protein